MHRGDRRTQEKLKVVSPPQNRDKESEWLRRYHIWVMDKKARNRKKNSGHIIRRPGRNKQKHRPGTANGNADSLSRQFEEEASDQKEEGGADVRDPSLNPKLLFQNIEAQHWLVKAN